jgi:hypothetical protein
VESALRTWRAHFNREQAYQALADQGTPWIEAPGLLLIAVTARRLFRRYLRVRFHFDARRLRFMREALCDSMNGDHEVVTTQYAFDMFTTICQEYILWEIVWYRGLLALHIAHAEGQNSAGILAEAAAAMRQIFTEFPRFVGVLMESPSDVQRESSVVSMAGWAATQISLARNPRLAAALREELATRGEDALSPYDELLTRLPANTSLAWHEEQWETLAELRTRIAYLVEHDGSERMSREELDEEPSSESSQQVMGQHIYEAFVEHLEVEDEYKAWMQRAGLTALEEAVTHLKLEEYTEQEITTALALPSKGSVKQAWLRAREKLKRAINQ